MLFAAGASGLYIFWERRYKKEMLLLSTVGNIEI